jgi:hypothetical protein
MIVNPPVRRTLPGSVWRRRDVAPESARRGRPLADKTFRATLQRLFPDLWAHLTESGRAHLVADAKAAKQAGELQFSQTILDWHVTMAFVHEQGFLENVGRQRRADEPVFDLDEFLAS